MTDFAPRPLDWLRVWLHRQVSRGAHLASERRLNREFLETRRFLRMLKIVAAEQGWDLSLLEGRDSLKDLMDRRAAELSAMRPCGGDAPIPPASAS